MCNEIREEVMKINDKFKETQNTLALILAKLINPNAVQVDGFAPPPITPPIPVTSSTPRSAPSTSMIAPVTPAVTPITSLIPTSVPSTSMNTPAPTSSDAALVDVDTVIGLHLMCLKFNLLFFPALPKKFTHYSYFMLLSLPIFS